MRRCPGLIFQILTKRPERITKQLPAFWDEIAELCWIGTSVENYKDANDRYGHLRDAPILTRFYSVEPMLEEIPALPLDGISWTIVGGESGGTEARPCNVRWIRSIVDQCRAASVPVFVKQLGAHPFADEQHADPAKRFAVKGHWNNGRFSPILTDQKGGDIAEWPADIRVREFPRVAERCQSPVC